jgi:hypothetical protein
MACAGAAKDATQFDDYGYQNTRYGYRVLEDASSASCTLVSGRGVDVNLK